MFDPSWIPTILYIAELLLRLGLSLRVIMRRLPTGVTASWLILILFIPYVGAALYLLVGESRIGRMRAKRERAIHPVYVQYLSRLRERTDEIPQMLSHVDARLSREVESATGQPTMGGNTIELLKDANAFFHRVLEQIEGAQRSVAMEFFIWDPQGQVQEVTAALIAAAKRGVDCRVLVDAVGSRRFLRSAQAKALRKAGVRVVAALPAGFGRAPLFYRIDHRNHRKLVIIDDQLAFFGSMNMADPAYFKVRAGVGKWVDLMAVVEGPAVEVFALEMVRDWEIESGDDQESQRNLLEYDCLEVRGNRALQLVPSGPTVQLGCIHAIVLSTMYAAQKTLTITTPYFVPDQAVMTALVAAARRGVKVLLILPAQSDAKLTQLAGQSFYDDLLGQGVRIVHFQGGLLHSKTIVVDEEIALFGTVNLDQRSFWLNFEMTLICYDNAFACDIIERQNRYLANSIEVDAQQWLNRSFPARFKTNIAQFFSPLL